MNTWGNKIRLSIFGESHGEAIGIVIDGLEAGTKLNLENINKFIERRKAGKSSFTTSKQESILRTRKVNMYLKITGSSLKIPTKQS